MSSTGTPGGAAPVPDAEKRGADGDAPRRVVVAVSDDRTLQQLSDAIDAHPNFEVVATATNGTELLDRSDEHRPAIVVLDHELPGLAGGHHLTHLRRTLPWLRFVMYTERDDQPLSGSGVDPADTVSFTVVDPTRIVSTLDHLASQPLSASWRLEADTANVSAARRVTGEILAAWGCDALVDDAQLVVTELVTNAIVHVGSACTVSLRLNDDGLRIEVTDHDPTAPEPQPFDLHREGGRGLLIVSALSTAWGIDPAEGGKTVWADLVA